MAVCLATGLMLVADLFFGGRLHIMALLGTTFLFDMRSFGLTNMTTEILITVTVWVTAVVAGRSMVKRDPARWAAYAVLAVVAAIIGAGALGADFGGCIAAIATFLTFAVVASERDLSGVRIAAIAAGTAAGAGLAILMDSLFFHTYLSRAVGGTAARFARILQNKASMHIGEIKYVLIPSVILLALVVLLILVMRRPGFWARQWKADRPRTAALFSLLVGGLVGFAFNDTGITMLAVTALLSLLVLSYYSLTGAFPAGEDGSGPPATPGG
jgi:hypothetical protein